jgi:predicted RNA binding protein YcfA (HicA-like mRNA interferase family)
MRLPRDLSGTDLARALAVFGYEITRQTGSHLRLTTQEAGEHHVTIPAHDSLRIGTLAAIVDEVGRHLGVNRSDLLERLFGAR